jgi:hypothetical protein
MPVEKLDRSQTKAIFREAKEHRDTQPSTKEGGEARISPVPDEVDNSDHAGTIKFNSRSKRSLRAMVAREVQVRHYKFMYSSTIWAEKCRGQIMK